VGALVREAKKSAKKPNVLADDGLSKAKEGRKGDAGTGWSYHECKIVKRWVTGE